MNRLRVAIDVTPLLGPPTGIHQVTRGLLEALVDHDDIDLHGWLLTARGAPPTLDIPVHHSRVPAALAIRGWAHSALPPGRLVTGRADVVHGTNFLAPPAASSVITLQDMTPLRHREWCEPAVAAMAGAVRHAVSKGATLHVSSELVRREALDEFEIDEDRVRLVHHAVTTLVGGDPSHGRGIAGAEHYVLTLGRVEKRKNIPAAVRALRDIPDDIVLVVAGPQGNDEEALQRAIADSRRRIVRLPQVSDRDRAGLVTGATALLWPSHYEGFALPPLEALSVGTPIIATAVGALPELLGDWIPLVAPGDDDAFTDALVSAVTSPPDVPSRVRDRISALTWERAAEQMIDIYRDVACR